MKDKVNNISRILTMVTFGMIVGNIIFGAMDITHTNTLLWAVEATVCLLSFVVFQATGGFRCD